MTQYSLVGAWWGGVDDRTELFIKKGYWQNGWGNEKPNYARLTNQIRRGDRIAIKKRASNPKMIEVRALGTITGARAKNQRVDVDWLKIGLRHKVGIRGCVGTISGPFSLEGDHRREWVRRVFLLDRFDHVLGPEELLDVDEAAVLAQEGGRKLRVHFRIERNRKNAMAKRQDVLRREGCLECEVCRFDFAKQYGELGEWFCEVHHRILLSEVDGPITPRLSDLAIVCSNCHRMIHRTKPMLSVEDFRDKYTPRSGAE